MTQDKEYISRMSDLDMHVHIRDEIMSIITQYTGLDMSGYWMHKRVMSILLPALEIGFDQKVHLLNESHLRTIKERLASSSDFADIFIAKMCPSTIWFNRGMIMDEISGFCKKEGYRVLSAGCAFGSELYSVGIQFLEEGLTKDDICLVGADLNPFAIRQAIEGRYESEKFDHPWNRLEQELREKYFVHKGETYTACEKLRDIVEFRGCNLMDSKQVNSISDGKFDVVLCRNVLKYFSVENQRIAIENLESCFRPGSIFIIGTGPDEVSINELDIPFLKQINRYTFSYNPV